MKPDLINGSFEFVGSLTIWLSIYKLHKDKQVRGIHWLPIVFFFCWGLWNLFYYPYLGQWISFVGGCSVIVANAIWLSQMIYYRSN